MIRKRKVSIKNRNSTKKRRGTSNQQLGVSDAGSAELEDKSAAPVADESLGAVSVEHVPVGVQGSDVSTAWVSSIKSLQ